MRKCTLLCLILLSGLISLANDGSFYASGNTLIPLKETTIQMKKEILSLDRKGDWMQVDIYFEFFNPGPEKELTVGFVTPPAYGDITEAEETHPQVKNFMVMTGDRILPFKISRMEESGFKISNKLAEGVDFVYYFTVRFAKGITVIRHSYLYRGGGSVEATNDFLYRLTTGASWAGGSIGDFELNINMGDDCYFAVPASFGSTAAAWTLIGVGRIGAVSVYNPYGDEDGGRALRMVYLRKGKLQLRQLNFKPQKDLGLTVFQFHNEVNLWTDKKAPHVFENAMELLMGDSTVELLSRMTDLELRLYRNLHFARMGYDFRDEALKKVFMMFTWYIPDPAVKAENAPDYYLSKELLKLIAEEERRRKQN